MTLNSYAMTEQDLVMIIFSSITGFKPRGYLLDTIRNGPPRKASHDVYMSRCLHISTTLPTPVVSASGVWAKKGGGGDRSISRSQPNDLLV